MSFEKLNLCSLPKKTTSLFISQSYRKESLMKITHYLQSLYEYMQSSAAYKTDNLCVSITDNL
jgi:hypothetical protein